jgi:Leucine-rich repeat (LRR) protein
LTRLPTLPKELRHLKVQNTPLQSIPDLPDTLVGLSCDATPLTELPTLPKSLLYLYCKDTVFPCLPELPPQLSYLDISHTKITHLPPLPLTLRVLKSENTPLLLEKDKTESFEDYNLRWEELRSKERILSRTKVLAEDIIAATWHPDRFEKWCLDEEEKKENDAMFA